MFSRKAIILFFAMAASLFAQSKVAYINMNDVFEKYYKTINANIIFENKKKEYDEKITMMATELESALRDVRTVEAEAQNELLAKDAREEALRKYRVRAELFQTKRNDFERARQQGRADLLKVREETEEILVKELRGLVEKFSASNGYTHVYDVSGLSLNRMPYILVYPKEQEITAAFITSINSGHEAEITDAKAKLDAMRENARMNANTEVGKQ